MYKKVDRGVFQSGKLFILDILPLLWFALLFLSSFSFVSIYNVVDGSGDIGRRVESSRVVVGNYKGVALLYVVVRRLERRAKRGGKQKRSDEHGAEAGIDLGADGFENKEEEETNDDEKTHSHIIYPVNKEK